MFGGVYLLAKAPGFEQPNVAAKAAPPLKVQFFCDQCRLFELFAELGKLLLQVGDVGAQRRNIIFEACNATFIS